VSPAGRLDDLAAGEPHPGVQRRVLHGEHATLTHYRFAPGAAFPVHRHRQEQLTVVVGGSVTLVGEGPPRELAAGAWFTAVPGAPHGLTAGGDGAEVIAVVAPARGADEAVELLADGTCKPPLATPAESPPGSGWGR